MKLKFIIESLEYVLDILMSYLVPFNRLLEFENSSFTSVCISTYNPGKIIGTRWRGRANPEGISLEGRLGA